MIYLVKTKLEDIYVFSVALAILISSFYNLILSLRLFHLLITVMVSKAHCCSLSWLVSSPAPNYSSFEHMCWSQVIVFGGLHAQSDHLRFFESK